MIGLLFFATMAFELLGLRETSSSTTSFLENTAILFVPLFESLLRRSWPQIGTLISGAMALGGVACLTLHDGSLIFARGECYCMLAALFYAVTIVATDRLSKKDDAVLLGIIQVWVIGVLGMVCAFMLEQSVLPTDIRTWGAIAFLSVVCTGFGFTLQPVAQKYTSPEKAGLYCAFNPLIAAVLGVIFLNEQMTHATLLGAGLILGSIISKKEKSKQSGNRIQFDLKWIE